MKAKKPKRNPWKDASPYGVYEGPKGNPEQWKAAFQEALTPEQAHAILGDDNPYVLLDIEAGSSQAQVKSAFRKAALKFHPDRNPDRIEWAAEQFKKIYAAYVTLGGGK